MDSGPNPDTLLWRICLCLTVLSCFISSHAPSSQPVQGGDIELLLHLAVLYKNVRRQRGRTERLGAEPAEEAVAALNRHLCKRDSRSSGTGHPRWQRGCVTHRASVMEHRIDQITHATASLGSFSWRFFGDSLCKTVYNIKQAQQHRSTTHTTTGDLTTNKDCLQIKKLDSPSGFCMSQLRNRFWWTVNVKSVNWV